MTVSGIDRTEVTPRVPARWYRSKTFLLGLFGFLSLFWFWADSVQMTTMLLVGSKRVPGYVSAQTYHGSIGFLIQECYEPGEVPEWMCTRARSGVGALRRFGSFPARFRWDADPVGISGSMPVAYLLRGYGLLWLGVLWWRWRKLRARG